MLLDADIRKDGRRDDEHPERGAHEAVHGLLLCRPSGTGADGLMLRVDETAGVQPQPWTEWVDSRTLKVGVPGGQVRAAGLYGFVLLQFRTCNVYGFPLTGLNTFTYD